MMVLINELSIAAAQTNLKEAVINLMQDIAFVRKISPDRVTYVASGVVGLRSLFLNNGTSKAQFTDVERKIVLAFLGSTREVEAHPTVSHTEVTTGAKLDHIETYKELAGGLAISLSLRTPGNWSTWDACYRRNGAGAEIDKFWHVGNLNPAISSSIMGAVELLKHFAALDNLVQDPVFPKLKYSNALLDKAPNIARLNGSPGNNTAIYRSIGQAVAEVNGYTYRSDLGRKNKFGNKMSMVIFENAALGFYLSIDFMHGTLEVCGNAGKHIREVNYSGNILGGPSKKHGIRV